MASKITPSIAFCLMGPTASGKTDVALALAEKFPVEIINVDSSQIYRGMDIGSGKPSLKVRQQVTHHLMDFLDPAIAYSAAMFREDALACMEEIKKRKKIPLLVGGTMLYFKVLQQGLSPLPEADPILRRKLELVVKEEGLEALYQRLQGLDPLTAKRLQPTDSQRIQRALEVAILSGKPMSYWLAQPKECNHNFYFCNIALMPIETSRAVLHHRIEARFDKMLADGLMDEVNKLFQRSDLNLSLPSLRAVGYRQVWRYLLNEITHETMRENAISATRQLAKRQLTWLRSWPQLKTFDFLDPTLLEKISLVLNQNSD